MPSSPAAEAHKNNRRRSERKPYAVEAWLSSPTAKDPKDRHEVIGVNISRHGVAFELPVAVPTGAYFIFEVGYGAQQLRSEVRILSCKKHEERYRIGAEFR
jgi:PilZ domain